MNQYDIGDAPKMTVTFTADGINVDPSTITFKLKQPDWTITTYVYGTDAELTKEATGRYAVFFTLTQAGEHSYRFTGTGTVKAAYESEFNVRRSDF